MASSIAFRRAASSPPVRELFNVRGPLRPLAVAASSFNTNADQVTANDQGGRSVVAQRSPDTAVYRRRDPFPSLFSDVFDPFSPTRTVSQLLSLVDQFMTDPFFGSRVTTPGAAVSRRGWDVREDENALFIKMDMPGVDKESVKVTVEQNTLTIKGEGVQETEEEEEESRRRYSSRILLDPVLYKSEEIKAEMKNGVLKVIVPKVKGEGGKDVQEIKVE